MLNGTTKKLEKKLNINFENASLTSSTLPFRKKVPNSRKPTGRKPDVQPGHKPHNASKLSATKEPVYLPTPDEFLNNSDIYPTGTRHHAPFPSEIANDITYGVFVKALVFLLNNYYNVSTAKIKQCIYGVTKGLVNLSTKTICNLS